MLFILKCNGNVTGCLGDGRLFFLVLKILESSDLIIVHANGG